MESVEPEPQYRDQVIAELRKQAVEYAGKITVPHHSGDIAAIIVRSILKQAGL